jgi:WD40 repeat protein
MMKPPRRSPCAAAFVLLAFMASGVSAQPIPITSPSRSVPVNFDTEIVPILRRSCLACHSTSDANGELVLESPQSILRGGDSGPAVVAGKSSESLLLKLAAHQDDPAMPPAGNDVSAKDLSSQELGLIKLWIDQGAKGSGATAVLSPESWRPLPPGQHPVSAVAVSPDGQFAACGRANQIFIYHVATGQVVTRLTDPALLPTTRDNRPGIAHLDVVQSLSFNNQGDLLASGGFRTAKLWRYPRDVQMRSLPTDAELRAVAVSPDGSHAATGGADGKIRLWALATSTSGEASSNGPPAGATAATPPVLLSGHTSEIRGLCFTADSGRLISTSADKSIRVWNTADGELAGRIDTHAELNGVTSLMQPPTDATAEEAVSIERIVTGGADNFIRFWNIPTGLPLPLADVPAKVTAISTSLDGTLLAMGTADGLVRIVDSQTNATIQQWSAHSGPIHDIALGQTAQVDAAAAEPSDSAPDTPKEWLLATAGEDGVVRVWGLGPVQAEEISPAEIATAEKGTFETKAALPIEWLSLRGSLVPIRSVAFRPDGQQLVMGADDGAVTVWNLKRGMFAARTVALPAALPVAPAALPVAPAALPVAPAVNPRHLAVVSPDNKFFATTSTLNGHAAILVKDVATGERLHTLLGHGGPVVSLAFSSDSKRIVSGSTDATARVWDLATSKFPEVARFSEHTEAVTAVAFNSDSQQVLSGSSDKSVKLWGVADAVVVMDFPGHTGPIVAVAMLPNNQPCSASADKTVRVWNPANGQAARSQTEPAAVTAMSVSRDGVRIAVALADNSVKLYAAAGGAAQLTMTGHQSPPHSLAFNADNSKIVSGDAQSAIVWDAADGRLLEISPRETELTSVGYVQVASEVAGQLESQIVLADSGEGLTLQPSRFAGAARGMLLPITGVAWHPGGQSIIASCQDGTVRGFNLANFAQLFSANHGAAVHGLAISNDGTKLASGGENKIVRLWNPANGAALQPAQLTEIAGPVQCVGFSADSERLIAGTLQGELVVFHLTAPNGVIEQSIIGHDAPLTACLALDADGQAVSLSEDGIVLRWELLAAQRLTGHSQAVTSVASIPNQEGQPPQILSGSLDGTMRRWNALTGQALGQMNHGAPITSIAVRNDGQRWASASSNNTIRLWNATNNGQVAQMVGDLRAKSLVAKLTQQKNDATAKVTGAKVILDTAQKALPVKVAAETAAATLLATATTDVEAKATVLTAASTKKAEAEKLAIEAAAVAQLAAGKMEAANQLAIDLTARSMELTAKAARPRAVASVNPDNAALAKLAATAAANALAADAAAKAAVAAKAAPTTDATQKAQAAATVAQAAIALNKPFTDADTALALAQSTQRSAKQAHDVATRDLEQATNDVPVATQSLANVEALLAKVDSDLVVATAAETAAQQPIRAVAFSPDNLTLASGGDQGVVHTWNAETGAAISSHAGHVGPVSMVAYLDNDTLISSSTDKNAVVWNLNPSWQLERVIGNVADPSILVDRVASVDISSDGKLLVTGGGVPSRSGEVKIWNIADGALLQEMLEAHTDAVSSVAFSPDDQFVASASADKYLKKFETATGKQVAQFEGHTNYVLGVSWRGGGKVLASSGSDGTIRIWNADSGDSIRVIRGITKQVSAIRFVGETQFAVVVTGEAFVRKYNIDNGGVQTNYAGADEFMLAVDSTGDPNNGVVVAGGFDGQLRIWRTNGPVIRTIGPPQEPAADADDMANDVSSGENAP